MTTNDSTNQPPTNDPAPAPEKQAAAPKKAAPASYVVKHAYVGEWPEGTVLSTDDLKGIDVQRLLNLEAIEKVKA